MIKETINKLFSYYNTKNNVNSNKDTYNEIMKIIEESGKDPEEILKSLFDDECEL